jgi:hypothetical protein
MVIMYGRESEIVIGSKGNLAATMPTDLSMWDINPKTGATPLTIQWLGYLIIQGYAPTYAVMNGEYVQLQVSDQMGNWIDISGAAMPTSTNSANGYYGYFNGTYLIPTTWSAGVYQFRVFYPGSMTKGLAAITSPTITITVTSVNDKGTSNTTKYVIIAAAGIAAVALIGVATSK